MKGVYGLLVAIGLGVAGALLNWAYLHNRSLDTAREAFVGVASGARIRAGDVIRKEDLAKVEIPKDRVGNLATFAVSWSAVDSVAGINAVRDFEPAELILQRDLRTPDPEPRPLADDERELGVPVDTRTFVPSLYRAGDFVSFVVPKPKSILQPGAAPPESTANEATETIGPFEIRTIGNRVASTEVSRATRLPQVQENVINIIVQVEPDGELDAKARKLSNLLLTQNVRQLVVLGHPRPRRD
jgi:hypothetical protein